MRSGRLASTCNVNNESRTSQRTSGSRNRSSNLPVHTHERGRDPQAEVAEARGVVQVSNISTAEDLTWDPASGRDRPYVFRVCGSDTVMGALLAEFAARRELVCGLLTAIPGVRARFTAPTFNEFVVDLPRPAADVINQLAHFPIRELPPAQRVSAIYII